MFNRNPKKRLLLGVGWYITHVNRSGFTLKEESQQSFAWVQAPTKIASGLPLLGSVDIPTRSGVRTHITYQPMYLV